MGNPDHKRWLLEGVDAWNTKRAKTGMLPDLQGEDVTGLLGIEHAPATLHPPHPALKGINLRSADLRGAILENLDLSNSNFAGARMEDARLGGSKFTGSSFWLSHLDRALMVKCDLSNTVFEHTKLISSNLTDANLTNSDFYSCQLREAKFFNTNLSGASFALSRPWEARLFLPKQRNAVDLDLLSDVVISSVGGLIEGYRKLAKSLSNDVTL